MITRRVRIQLMVFAVITLLGVTYVGATYARLDRLFLDTSYTVVAHFPDAGGAFVGSEVSYRGVQVGRVEEMTLTRDGIDLHLEIDNEHDRIPADALAVVGNRSAVGEQYVELQPQSDDGPYLRGDSEIALADTRTPIRTESLLTDISRTVSSVDEDDLRTVVSEFGAAFEGSGRDLQTIIDSGNGFLQVAADNIEVTRDLLRDGNTVLRGQVASSRDIRSFARDLRLFTGALAGSDDDLRAVIDNGSATAEQLRTFLEENRVDLGELINNLVTTGEVVVRRLDGVEQLLVLYPYVVSGGFSVVAKTPSTGNYDAHFGLILTQSPPVCTRGYEGTDRRPPQDGENRPMAMDARCTEPPTESNPRGAQNAPRAPVAAYDPETGDVAWGAEAAGRTPAPSVGATAPTSLGEESWKWLYLQPLTAR